MDENDPARCDTCGLELVGYACPLHGWRESRPRRGLGSLDVVAWLLIGAVSVWAMLTLLFSL